MYIVMGWDSVRSLKSLRTEHSLGTFLACFMFSFLMGLTSILAETLGARRSLTTFRSVFVRHRTKNGKEPYNDG